MKETVDIRRDSIRSIHELTDEIAGLLETVPYGVGRQIDKRLTEICGIVDESLPGGEMATCEHCDKVCGLDEVQRLEDVCVCFDCLEEAVTDLRSTTSEGPGDDANHHC